MEAADGLRYGKISDLNALFQRQMLTDVIVQILFQQRDVSWNMRTTAGNGRVTTDKLADFQKDLAAFIHDLVDVHGI